MVCAIVPLPSRHMIAITCRRRYRVGGMAIMDSSDEGMCRKRKSEKVMTILEGKVLYS